MTTNDEIINKHTAKCKKENGSILCVRDCMNEARLATLDDCELFLKGVQSENPYELTWGECKGYAVAITRALAELETLRKKAST